MNIHLKKLVTLAGLAIAAVTAHAQSVPMAVNYQGRLTQPNGLPLTSLTATIRLKIFPVVSGGTASWDSGDRVVILRNGGIFSVMLGDTSVGMPALTQAVFQQGIVYLEVSIAGQPVSPRQPIVSVPWSILSGQSNLALTVSDEAITSKKLATDAGSLSKITGGKLGMVAGTLYHRAGFTTQQEISSTASTGATLILRADAIDASVESANSYLLLNGASGIRMDGGVGIGTWPGEAALEVEAQDVSIIGRSNTGAGVYGVSSSGSWGGEFTPGVRIIATTPKVDFKSTSAGYNVRLANDQDGALSLLDATGNPTAGLRAGSINLYGTDDCLAFNGPGIRPYLGLNPAQSELALHGGALFLAMTPNSLRCAGEASKPGGGSWAVSSDIRLKKDIRPIANPLQTLLRLQGVSFEYRDPSAICERGGKQAGFIAQEVEKVFPQWVTQEASGFKSISLPVAFDALSVEAIREQQSQIERLRRENARLQGDIKSLRSEFESRLRRLEASSKARP